MGMPINILIINGKDPNFNILPRRYTWYVGDWSSCLPQNEKEVNCAAGIRQRFYRCVRQSGKRYNFFVVIVMC